MFTYLMYPLLRKCGIPVTDLRKIGTGLVLTVLAVLSSALVNLYMESFAGQECTAPNVGCVTVNKF
jgi:hypothetical protein